MTIHHASDYGFSIEGQLPTATDDTTQDEGFKVKYLGPFVNVYLIDRAYGGPEEGGWWYDTGQAIRSEQYSSQEEAEEARDAEKAWCNEENRHRRSDIGSVLSEGKYVVYIEDDPGADFPTYTPHYE